MAKIEEECEEFATCLCMIIVAAYLFVQCCGVSDGCDDYLVCTNISHFICLLFAKMVSLRRSKFKSYKKATKTTITVQETI